MTKNLCGLSFYSLVNFSIVSFKLGNSFIKSSLLANSKSAKSNPGATVQLTKEYPFKFLTLEANHVFAGIVT